jgi:hypothetical protein
MFLFAASRKISKYQFCGGHVGIVGLLWCCKIAEGYLRTPHLFFGVPRRAFQATAAFAFGVMGVLLRRNISQIGKSIIDFVAVDVVDHACRPVAGNDEPRQPMSEVRPSDSAEFELYAPISVDFGARWPTGMKGVPVFGHVRSELPPEAAGIRVVIQNRTNELGRQVVARGFAMCNAVGSHIGLLRRSLVRGLIDVCRAGQAPTAYTIANCFAIAAILLALFLAVPALAQPGAPVQSTGSVTPGHVTSWNTPGVVQDGGSANSPGITSLGVIGSGLPSCIVDSPVSGPYHQLCLGANALGGGLLSYQAYNGATPLPLSANVNGTQYPLVFPSVNGLPQVASNSALKALAAGAYTTVYRAGFYLPGDGGGAFYTWSSSACSLNAGAGDNGLQVAPNTGTGCWIANFNGVSTLISTVWGTKGDGATNDSTAAQNALTASGLLGGLPVFFPPTGHAYLFNTGLVAGSASLTNVSLEGSGGLYWPGYDDNTEGDWTAHGTWFHCTDTVNTCISLSGNGGHVKGINFWYTQPTPPGSNCGTTCTFTHDWTPTTYPYTITVQSPQNFNHISDISVINATNCIDIEGPTTGVGSFETYIEHSQLGCFNTGVKFGKVDNHVDLHYVDFLVLWYQAYNDVWGYMEGDSTVTGHKVDMDMYYLSDASFEGVQFYQSWAAIRATDATVGSGLGSVTFAAQGLQFANTNFNQVCQAIVLAANTTHFNADFTNTVLNIDPQTSVISGQCGDEWPDAINVNSNNADVSFTNINGFEAQTLANIGGGTSGGLHLSGRVRITYSSFATGAPAINVNTGGFIDMVGGINNLFPASGGGAQCAGACRNWPVVPGGDSWIAGPTGVNRQQLYLTITNTGGFDTRWGTFEDNTTESGSNAGSNFGIARYADSGSFIDTPLEITRSTGLVSLEDGLNVVGGYQAAGTAGVTCSGSPTSSFASTSGIVTHC